MTDSFWKKQWSVGIAGKHRDWVLKVFGLLGGLHFDWEIAGIVVSFAGLLDLFWGKSLLIWCHCYFEFLPYVNDCAADSVQFRVVKVRHDLNFGFVADLVDGTVLKHLRVKQNKMFFSHCHWKAAYILVLGGDFDRHSHFLLVLESHHYVLNWLRYPERVYHSDVGAKIRVDDIWMVFKDISFQKAHFQRVAAFDMSIAPLWIKPKFNNNYFSGLE